MVYSCRKPRDRTKAVRGNRSATTLALLALFVIWSIPADAQKRAKAETPAKVQHSKLDKELNRVADGIGDSDVIVEFHDDSDGSARIKAAGGSSGRRLGNIKARAGRMPNALLKRLADDPKVKRVHRDRETEAQIARAAATIGARNVHAQYGYDGAGVGVAVIDSGITPFHSDLSVADGQGQRVAAFVDFVNGQTQKYDDWGHGTHVAGIIAGNGYDSTGARLAIAPGASIIALKALDGEGKGRISYIIAALDWAVAHRDQYNIRVINMSLGTGVLESYHTDPLTLAAKHAVDNGIVVVAAAGNMGKAANGQPQYGAITAPGNAPWVLTVGASSTMGTTDRRDDTVALYSSRGPTMVDFLSKPDLVAPGTAIVSLSDPNSLFYVTKAAFLQPGKRWGLPIGSMPYLTLSGTSMAAPVVSGTVALMLQANPTLTPNMVKGILQYTAQVYTGYNYLTQGAGFLNTLGAVRLSRFFAVGQKGDHYPNMKAWSKHLLWGNRRVSGGVLTPGGTAWGLNIVWGESQTPNGQNIVWGENCSDVDCDNIVWGNNIVWGYSDADDNIVWSNTDGDNIVWGNSIDDNIVWGNAEGIDNIVWGNTTDPNSVWGSSTVDENVSWGNSAGEGEDYGDDTLEIEAFDPSVWDDLFSVPLFGSTTSETSGTTTTTTTTETVIAPLTTSYVLGGGVQ